MTDFDYSRKMCCCECGHEGEYESLSHAYEHGWFEHECVSYCSDHASAAIEKMENEVRLRCHKCPNYVDWDMRLDVPLGWYKAKDLKWFCKCCAEYPYAIDNNIMLVQSHI